MEQYKEYLTLCERILKGANIKEYEILLKVNNGASFNISDENGESCGELDASIQVKFLINNNFPAFFKTRDISEAGILSSFHLAKDVACEAKQGLKQKFHQIPRSKTFINKGYDLSASSSVREQLEENFYQLKSLSSNVKVNNLSLDEIISGIFYKNHLGEESSDSFCSAQGYTSFNIQDNNNAIKASSYELSAENLSKVSWKEIEEKIEERGAIFSKLKDAPKGKQSVVFSPEAFLKLILSFSSHFSAQAVLDNDSIWKKESLNSEKFSTLLTLTEFPQHEKNFAGYKYIDEEGVDKRKVTLIDKGVFSSFIHTSYTAKEMNCELTGNARFSSKVFPSPNFWVVESGKDDLTQILKQEGIIYIEDIYSLHAGVNVKEASFSLPFLGWQWENGKKIGLNSAAISGDFIGFLKDIKAVGNDAVSSRRGVSPSILVDGLSVTPVS